MNQSASIWTLSLSGPVTREGVRARARELALCAGRAPANVAQRDYEQAKREVTGESDPDRQEAILEKVDARS
jgi:hypothetical protein